MGFLCQISMRVVMIGAQRKGWFEICEWFSQDGRGRGFSTAQAHLLPLAVSVTLQLTLRFHATG
jgi:hypothetical protein